MKHVFPRFRRPVAQRAVVLPCEPKKAEESEETGVCPLPCAKLTCLEEHI